MTQASFATTLGCAAIAATGLLAAAPAAAQSAAAKSPHTLTANVGAFSQYVFRGLTQTDRKPALQGGFDYGHESGFYAGTWGSNVSWIDDAATTAGVSGISTSVEIDGYLGYKTTFDDFGVDAGFLTYWYPGHYPSGWVKPNTNELYVAGSWKWLMLKYSYSLGDTFGVDNAKGTWYLDLTAAYPITEQLSLVGHVGYQKYRGSVGGVSNDDLYSYTDWKLELAYALEGGWTIGAAYTGTNAEDAGYTLLGRNIGKDTGYVYVKKTF